MENREGREPGQLGSIDCPVAQILFRQTQDQYGSGQYHEHLLEQYKLYVGTVDSVSSRRQTANGFFLTLNTAMLAFLGLIVGADDGGTSRGAGLLKLLGFEADSPGNGWPLVPVLGATIAGIAMCFVWSRLVASYRSKNDGKFLVIHALERRLPVALFDAEWEALGRGKEPGRHRPFTHVEMLTPWIFVLLYVALAVWQILQAIDSL